MVVKLNKKTVLIKTQRTGACDNCASKKSCGTAGSVDNEIIIEADNTIGASLGDKVVFTVGAASVLKAGLLLYLLPIVFFIFGVVLGQTVAVKVFPDQNPDLISGLLGASFLALAFFGLKIYSKFIEKNKAFRPQVLRVE
ncbi:MAG: SoxR reducing system RseC family protein [Deltaproteobacteria bacterium]|nr:SoxR reducing system RseC family protein [Deltaproteobacteria bacterium]